MSDSETGGGPQSTERFGGVPERWDSGSVLDPEEREDEDIIIDQENLEPEQRFFLSRLVELEDKSTARLSQPSIPSRLNFGLPQQADPKIYPTTPETARRFKKNDKGYFGVINQQLKQQPRKDQGGNKAAGFTKQSDSSSSSDSCKTRNEQGSPLHSPSLRSKQFLVNKDTLSRTKPLASSQCVNSLEGLASKPASSPIECLKSVGSLSSNEIPTLSKLSDQSKQTNFTIPSLGGISSQPLISSFSIPTLGAVTKSSFTIPTLGGAIKQPSKPSFTIPTLGGATNQPSKPSFTIPTLGGATNQPSKPSFTIPTLGGAVDQPAKSGFSIPPSLRGAGPDKPIGGSLSSLANLHLGSNPSNFSVPSLGGSPRDPGSPSARLSSLADLHLAQTGQQQTLRLLPSLSLKPQQQDLTPKKEIGEEPELEIDLSSALKGIEPNSASQEKQQDEERVEVRTTILADLSNLKGRRFLLARKSPSAFGKVVNKRWRRGEGRKAVRVFSELRGIQPFFKKECGIEWFSFTEPSPDDIVKKAQSQSRAFLNRASPARASPVLS